MTKRMRVSRLKLRSKRICQPTSRPSVQPCSSAIRRAAARAAIRRGSSTTTCPSPAISDAASAGGTRVVLPAPGGACSTALGPRAQAIEELGEDFVDRQGRQGRHRPRCYPVPPPSPHQFTAPSSKPSENRRVGHDGGTHTRGHMNEDTHGGHTDRYEGQGTFRWARDQILKTATPDCGRDFASLRVMTRIARLVVPGVAHHVTQRGNRRQTTFFRAFDYELYRQLLGEHCEKAQVSIWAYCLLPNHVHLIAVPRAADGLRHALSVAHRRYTTTINRREGWKGCLWQGGSPLSPWTTDTCSPRRGTSC